MVTKIRPFSTQICHNSACTNTTAYSRGVHTKHGIFGDGRFNAAIQIFRWPILVATVTKFGPFLHKIGHISAYTNATVAEYEVFGYVQFNMVYNL